MERIFLLLIDYELYIKSDAYAKYYFLLRTFAESKKKSFPLRALPIDLVLKLQRNCNKAECKLKEAYSNPMNKSFWVLKKKNALRNRIIMVVVRWIYCMYVYLIIIVFPMKLSPRVRSPQLSQARWDHLHRNPTATSFFLLPLSISIFSLGAMRWTKREKLFQIDPT